jgi:F420-non-reducing hydrogenase iron-sulfur subunit
MSENGKDFQPVIVGFLCNWCSYRAADLAGMSRLGYPANLRDIRIMCTGRMDPAWVLHALRSGADGVLVVGCHPGECHYIEGNYKAIRRMRLLKRTLAQLGVEDARVQLHWASASEGVQFAQIVNQMTEEVRALGPLNWKTNIQDNQDWAAAAGAHVEGASA